MNDSDYLIALGLNIKRIRSEKGLMQLELADLCGLDKQALYRIEKGNTNVTVKTLRRIAKALDVTVIDLLNFKTKK